MNYTFNKIETAFNGSETVVFNTRILETFTGEDGKQVTGCLNDLNYLLRVGYISSYQISKAAKGYNVTLQGFNPDVKVKSKKGNEFTWFNTASAVKRVLLEQQLITKQQSKRKTA